MDKFFYTSQQIRQAEQAWAKDNQTTTWPLMEKAGVWDAQDEGCIALNKADDAPDFVKTLGKLRHWDREPMVDLDG